MEAAKLRAVQGSWGAAERRLKVCFLACGQRVLPTHSASSSLRLRADLELRGTEVNSPHGTALGDGVA